METHFAPWLGAYHDGELRGARLQQVEAHLEGCELCRRELEGLRSLSAALKEARVPAFRALPLEATEQITASRRSARRAVRWEQVLKAGWLAVPFGLIAVWALFQAGLLIASLAGASGLEVDLWLPALTGIALWPSVASLLGGLLLEELAGELLRLLPGLAPAAPVVRIGLLNLAASGAIGVFLWSWIASWWAYRRRLHVEE